MDITDEQRREIKETLTAVFLQMYRLYPFYAMLLESCPIKLTNEVPRAAIDAQNNIYINPEYFAKLGLKQAIFILAHELMHAVLAHHPRMNGRELKKWNVATDLHINHMLTEDLGSDAQLEDIIYEANLNTNLTSENVYSMFPEDPQNPKGSSGPGAANGKGQDPYGSSLRENEQGLSDYLDKIAPNLPESDLIDPIDDAETVRSATNPTPKNRSEWEGQAARALTRAKMQGNAPLGAEMAMGKFLEPKIDWKQRLQQRLRFIVSADNRDDYSYTRPSRRFMSEDIIWPSLIGHQSAVAVWVDTSGSMHGNWLQACSDIEAIRRQYRVNIYLMWQDTELHTVGWLSPDDPFPEMAKGGGGTDFRAAFEHMTTNRLYDKCDALVGFTDCWGAWPDKMPEFPVLTISFSADSCPYGETIHVKDEDFITR